MKKAGLLIFSLFFFLLLSSSVQADSLPNRIGGRILLQVEESGEAWYINPNDNRRYFLGRPQNAFDIMTHLGIGISNYDLNKIPKGTLDKNQKNTYNYGFAQKHLGKIFLQVEKKGEAWYVNPDDGKRYFLSRPCDAFNIMRELGLGATNETINRIPIGHLSKKTQNGNGQNDYNQNGEKPQDPPRGGRDAEEVMERVARAIRSGDKEEAIKYFTLEMEQAVEYTLNFLDKEGREILANTLRGSELSRAKSSDTKKVYLIDISYGGYETTLEFRVKKQDGGRWLLTNL